MTYTATLNGKLINYSIRPKGGGRDTLTLRYTFAGERIRKDLRTSNQDKAEQAAILILNEHSATMTSAPLDDSPKLKAIVDWYTGTYCANLKPSTLVRYTQVLDDFLRFCRGENIGRAQQVNHNVVERWQAWLGETSTARGGKSRSASSTHDEESILRRMFMAREKTDPSFKSPIATWNIRKPRGGNSKYKALRLDVLRRFLALIDKHEPTISAITRWLAYTGWRPDEALDLMWEDVDLEAGCIEGIVPKTGRRRRHPITKPMYDILTGQEGGGFVFPIPSRSTGERGKKARRDYLRNHMKRCCIRHGYEDPIIPRDLRKTFGTLMANGDFGAPCPPHILKELMGHRDVSTTLTYYAVADFEGMRRWVGELNSAIETTEHPQNLAPAGTGLENTKQKGHVA